MAFHNELYYFLSRLKFLEECKELRELTDYAKDQIETLKFELRFLITFFKFISRDENFKGVLATIKTQIYRAGNRLFYLNVGSSNGDRAAMKDIACNLLHKIKPS
ncbi:hypothetical protein ACH5RR_030306 [Cinchona calisaya]|uniref:Uncharacterized protein n=1 Tax=Cinchona calisaya TaxID=153742 RepID=A0ABD2YU74_9GENT